MLIAYGTDTTNGARVGSARVGFSRVSSYEWLDITPQCSGMQWNQGKRPDGQGYPRADIGTLTFTLNDDGTTFQPFKYDPTNSLNREWRPGAIVRVVSFRPGAGCNVYFPGSGFTYIARTGWKPEITAVVDSWDYEIDEGDPRTATVTAKETLVSLVAVQTPPVSAVGANDRLITRLFRLTEAAGWKFPIVDSGQNSNFPEYYFDEAGYELQATTMSMNRLAEIYLTGDSIKGVQISTDGDGSLRVGVPKNTYTPHTQQVIRLQGQLVNGVTSDATNYPYAVVGYFEHPLMLRNSADSVINSASITRVGGTPQLAESTESIGQHGIRSLTRTDLIGINDGLAALYANGMVGSYDGYSDTYSPFFDQTIQPDAVIVTQQLALQRKLILGDRAFIDWYEAGALQVRFSGRITHIQHTVAVRSQSVFRKTTVSLLSTTNHLPS